MAVGRHGMAGATVTATPRLGHRRHGPTAVKAEVITEAAMSQEADRMTQEEIKSQRERRTGGHTTAIARY